MIAPRVRSLGWSTALAVTLIAATLIPTATPARAMSYDVESSVIQDDLEKELQSAIKSILAKHKKQMDELRARSETRIAELEAQTSDLRAQVAEMREALAARGAGAAGAAKDQPVVAGADRPFLGVVLGAPSADQLSKLGVDKGVLVSQVVPEAPAARVGLKAADVITRIAGKPVDFESFSGSMASAKAGDRVAIEYSRLVDGQPVRFEARVKLGRRGDFVTAEGAPREGGRVAPPVEKKPDPPVRASDPVKLGARVRQEAENNLVIVEVTPGSNAAEAGLRAGDKLVAIGDVQLATIETVKEALGGLKAGDTKAIVFMREGTKTTAKLKWGAGDAKPSLIEMKVKKPKEATKPKEAPKPKKKGFLGVSVDPSGGSLMIDEVIAGSSAAQMGLKVGDAIVSVNGKDAEDIDQLGSLFGSMWAGDSITIRVKRGEEDLTLKGTLGERKDGEQASAPAPESKPYVGIEVRERDRELEIAEVFGGSAAERAGIQIGDRLISIDGRSLARLEDIRAALDARVPGDVIDAILVRDGARVSVSLTLGAL